MAKIRLHPWMIAPAAVVLGGVAYGITTLIAGGRLPGNVPKPATIAGVPFADLRRPVWPLATTHPKRGLVSYEDVEGTIHGNASRRFAAYRKGRHHVGMDLYGRSGDLVLAMADGVVTATQTFHLGTHAIFVDHGDAVVMYGEVDPGSWKAYGVTKGSRVKKGQPIARMGCMRWDDGDCDSHMLHLETYRPGTTRNRRWWSNKAPHQAILDPTRMLLVAQPTAFA